MKSLKAKSGLVMRIAFVILIQAFIDTVVLLSNIEF